MKFHKPYYHQTVLRELAFNFIASSPFVPRHLRTMIYRFCGANIRTNRISARCHIGGKNISIGEGVFVNRGCMFDTNARISIGERCYIGPEVSFVTSTHEMGTELQRAGKCTEMPIEVGAGTWIGARAMILPGVRIGAGCVIAAGAVVTRDCEPNSLYAGTPATFKKSLLTQRGEQASRELQEGIASFA